MTCFWLEYLCIWHFFPSVNALPATHTLTLHSSLFIVGKATMFLILLEYSRDLVKLG